MRKLFSRIFLLSLLFLSFMPSFALGQNEDPPDDACDVYDGCPVPLDTFVFLMVITALVYCTWRLNKMQKMLNADKKTFTALPAPKAKAVHKLNKRTKKTQLIDNMIFNTNATVKLS